MFKMFAIPQLSILILYVPQLNYVHFTAFAVFTTLWIKVNSCPVDFEFKGGDKLRKKFNMQRQKHSGENYYC